MPLMQLTFLILGVFINLCFFLNFPLFTSPHPAYSSSSSDLPFFLGACPGHHSLYLITSQVDSDAPPDWSPCHHSFFPSNSPCKMNVPGNLPALFIIMPSQDFCFCYPNFLISEMRITYFPLSLYTCYSLNLGNCLSYHLFPLFQTYFCPVSGLCHSTSLINSACTILIFLHWDVS